MGSRYQICVSGAAKGQSVQLGYDLAFETGQLVAKSGHALLTGATTGLPEHAAAGYKKAGGEWSLGISPAATKVEHVLKYRLPVDNYDAILYTGLHYVGRDVLLINSSDAVISIGGRLGTLHEFTIAMETHTPVGFLQGGGGISAEIINIINLLPNIKKEIIVIDSDPAKLLVRLNHLLDKLNSPYKRLYRA